MTAKFGFAYQVQRSTSNTKSKSSTSKSNILVVDSIIMEANDTTAIGSVSGRIYDGGYGSNIITAKPAFGNKTHIPIKGECVQLYSLPSTNNEVATQYYYGDPISLYGNDSINYNPLSNSSNIDSEFNLDVKSLKPYKGDIIYEGRFGQGLRFSSTTSNNPWSNNTPQYNPITILSNGIAKTSSFVDEDWKDTQSSIWLTSTQQLNTLGLANENVFFTYNIIKPSEYKNPQIIVNSNRIILNSKEDEIILSSNKSINLSSNEDVNLDTNKGVNINSKDISLGSKQVKQPALLGDNTVNTLGTMIDALTPLITALSALPGINAPASTALTALTAIRTSLDSIKSKDVKLS